MTRMCRAIGQVSIVAASFFAASCLSNPAAAAENAAACSVRDKNGPMVIVVCPPGLDQGELRKAGEAACVDTKPCLAWIWDDVAKAPEKAPPLPDQLAKDAILSSAGIWDNDSQSLIMISEQE